MTEQESIALPVEEGILGAYGIPGCYMPFEWWFLTCSLG